MDDGYFDAILGGEFGFFSTCLSHPKNPTGFLSSSLISASPDNEMRTRADTSPGSAKHTFLRQKMSAKCSGTKAFKNPFSAAVRMFFFCVFGLGTFRVSQQP